MYQRQRADLQKKQQQVGSGRSPLQVDIGYGESSVSSYGNPRGASPHHSGPVTIVGGNAPRRNPRSSVGGSSGGCSSFGILCLLVSWTLIICGTGYAYYSYVEYPKIHKEIGHHHTHKFKEQINILEERNAELESKVKRIENDVDNQNAKSLQKSLDESLGRLRQEQENVRLWKDRADNAMKANKGGDKQVELNAAYTSLTNIKNAIQEQSKRLVIEKYGNEGPFKVEFEIHFPNDPQTENHYFVVELAPLQEMPHTIYTFLEQVSRGLYNVGTGGYSFHHNGGHIIQGGPIPNHLTTPNANLEERFLQSGYGHVLYQEYSESFPHVQYTLGFTGRPYSGPNFYINTRDNSKLHGPNGYSNDGYGDPCFGKIIHGHEVITRIHENSSEGGYVNDGEWKPMQAGPIAIKSIKII